MSSILCFTRLKCLLLLWFSKTSMCYAFMLFKEFNVFCFYAFQRLQYLLLLCFSKTSMSSIFTLYKTSMSMSYAFMPYRTSMSSILCFIGFQAPLFGVTGLQCPFVFSVSFLFCFLWLPVLNSQIARMKLVSLSLLIFYFQ